ncbi:hypothetical protein BS50DRAFT_654231 [Corynespora cassiicola Philippines]|uniref:Uncharacterized protein n=1 Tax=Corynespora cassiicola Philippines TaxID=1448308 RepID=A0A2T2P7F3_CORCC|nr:hypothetical protein BS50DRAFT_654231 [Corynespora cassiicola Philippines]
MSPTPLYPSQTPSLLPLPPVHPLQPPPPGKTAHANKPPKTWTTKASIARSPARAQRTHRQQTTPRQNQAIHTLSLPTANGDHARLKLPLQPALRGRRGAVSLHSLQGPRRLRDAGPVDRGRAERAGKAKGAAGDPTVGQESFYGEEEEKGEGWGVGGEGGGMEEEG